MKKIGVIGCTGRMGQLLQQEIAKHKDFTNGPGFSKSQSEKISLTDVFTENDYIVDFSQPELVPAILETATHIPKPLAICTTGWQQEDYTNLLNQAAQKAPIIIASNTSIGAYIQRHLVKEVAKLLGSDYDIDIVEKHHRNKVDIPSGTTCSLIQDIKDVKQEHYGMQYGTPNLNAGPRPNSFIGVNVQRSGNIPGDHEVSFTSADEVISIRHVAFNRALFVQGTLKIMEWLNKDLNRQPGIYTIADVLNINKSFLT